jgi:MoaA/NifB/PqqE/SkfB family radical SAM enzyme
MCEERSEYNRNLINRGRIMDFKIISQVVQDALPFGLKEIIPSTMGEPLLYPWMDGILKLCKDSNLKMNLTTNGTFPGRGVENWGKVIMPVASDIKISFNGSGPETSGSIMRGIDYDKQLENIRKLIEIRDEVRASCSNNPTITLQLTFMEKNFPELDDIIRVGIDLGVDRIKGHHLWVTWPELKEESLYRSAESRCRWNEKILILTEMVNRNRTCNGSMVRLENFNQLSENTSAIPSNWRCPFLGKEAWIAYDGTVNICCAPDPIRRTLGYYGNVKEERFMNLWHSSRYLGIVNANTLAQACLNCTLRRPLA